MQQRPDASREQRDADERRGDQRQSSDERHPPKQQEHADGNQQDRPAERASRNGKKRREIRSGGERDGRRAETDGPEHQPAADIPEPRAERAPDRLDKPAVSGISHTEHRGHPGEDPHQDKRDRPRRKGAVPRPRERHRRQKDHPRAEHGTDEKSRERSDMQCVLHRSSPPVVCGVL